MAVVHVIIAAENFAIPLLPVFKRVARGADADDGLASLEIFFEPVELIFRQRHAPDENDREVRLLQDFEAGDVVDVRAALAFEVNAIDRIFRLEEFFESRQRFRR